MLSCAGLFVTLWTIACQAPLSMAFSSQEYWHGLPFSPSGDLPDSGIEPEPRVSPALQAGPLPLNSLVAQTVKNLPPMQETWVHSLRREDPLEEGMATNSRILAWRILWTKEPGGLQSLGSQSRTRHSNFTSFPIFPLPLAPPGKTADI